MANYNRVILAGNLTRDPQLTYTPNNTPVVEFGMAINRKWRDQQGNQKDEVCFVDLRAYGRQAETINQYMSKGRSLLVEGRLQYQQWTATDGAKRSKHMVIVENFQFLGGAPPQAAEPAGGAQRYRSAAPAPAFGAGESSASPEMDVPPPVAEEPPPDNPAIPF